MKEWNNPELLSLGVENTFEGDYDTDPTKNPDNSQNEAHWCHAIGGKCTLDHNGAQGGHTSVNASHHHGPSLGEDLGADKVQNYSKCCCPGIS